MTTTIIKTILGEMEYPTKQSYVLACRDAARQKYKKATATAYFNSDAGYECMMLERSVMQRAAEHYDLTAHRGESLRSPGSY